MQTWDIRTLPVAPHQPQVLRSDGESRAIAIQLPAGEELQEHQVYERTYLVVAEGEIEVVHDGEAIRGGQGFLSHFEPNERRTIRATTDARLLLLLSPWPGVGHRSAGAQAQSSPAG
jgi:quercetin dioxygenase-like cupin family protein